MISYADGQFLASEKASIPIADDTGGSIRGYRIFTSSVIVNGKMPFALHHCQRLIDGAKTLNMATSITVESLLDILNHTIQKNPKSSVPLGIKIILTGGISVGHTQSGTAKIYISVTPLTLPPQSDYTLGVSLATFPYQRDIAATKLTYYVGTLLAEPSVQKYNAKFPLFISPTTQACLEGDTFNIFFVKNNTLFTPKADGRILDGISRQAIIRLAPPQYTTIETDIFPDQFAQFNEAFLTSSIRKVMPVITINATQIGNGKPGPVTQHFFDKLTAEVGF